MKIQEDENHFTEEMNILHNQLKNKINNVDAKSLIQE